MNYLLICFLRGIVAEEIAKFANLGEVNLATSDSIVSRIFRYIFKSHPANVNQISQLVAHILNFAMKVFKSNGDE